MTKEQVMERINRAITRLNEQNAKLENVDIGELVDVVPYNVARLASSIENMVMEAESMRHAFIFAKTHKAR